MSPQIKCEKCSHTFFPDNIKGNCPFCGASYDVEETIIKEETREGRSINWNGLPPKTRLSLEFIGGARNGEVFIFPKSKVIIGRKEGDLIIDDPHVSKKHASIEVWSRTHIYLKDLDSTNGTFLNGVRISRTKLQDGDIIQVGDTKLRFHISFD